MATEQQIDALAEWLWGHFGNRGMPRQWEDFSADQRAFWRLLAMQAAELLSPRLQLVPAVSREDTAEQQAAMQRVVINARDLIDRLDGIFIGAIAASIRNSLVEALDAYDALDQEARDTAEAWARVEGGEDGE